MVKSKMTSDHIKSVRNIVVKGFAKVEKRFDSIDQRLEGVDHKFEVVDNKFKGVESRFDRIEDSLGKLDKKIGDTKLELKQDIEGISLDIEDLAGMSAREFKAVRSDISHRNLLQDA